MNRSNLNTRNTLRVGGTPLWIVAVLLAFVAGALWRSGSAVLPAALAQGQAVAGARGVYAFTGQIEPNRYGLFMLDIEQGTVWCYAIDNQAGTRKLRLIAARSWLYDRYLRDFNSAEPTYRTVQQLVARQRAQEQSALSGRQEDEAEQSPSGEMQEGAGGPP
jgi:hypothetical protein